MQQPSLRLIVALLQTMRLPVVAWPGLRFSGSMELVNAGRRPSMMKLQTVSAGLVLIAACTGCGTSGADGSGPASPTSTAATSDEKESLTTTSVSEDFAGGLDGPVMFTPGLPSERGEEALIEGVLVRDGDCLFVGDGAPGTRFAVLWPFGTSWVEDGQEVIAANGTRIPLGASFSAGGGYGSPEMISARLDGDQLRERANECAEGEYRELAHVQHSIARPDTTTTTPATTAP